MPFLSVGGANRNGLINAQRLEDYSKPEGLDEIKKAGFEGVCFRPASCALLSKPFKARATGPNLTPGPVSDTVRP